MAVSDKLGFVMYDVIIIGAGIEGSAAAYYLTSKSNKKVLLLEQFEVLHTRGSSHGASRITRLAYNEAIYVNIMKEAYQLWDEIEKKSQRQLYWKTGILALGKATESSIDLYHNSLDLNGVPHKVLTGREAKKLYSCQLSIPDDDRCIFEPNGGVLKASKALRTLQELFLQQGGCLLDNHQVTKLIPGAVVTAVTDKGSFQAWNVILTTGAWTNRILESTGLTLPMKTYRAEVLYFKVDEPDAFSADNFPVFLTAHPPVTNVPSIYGTPILEYPGLLKVCQFFGDDKEIDPETRDSIPQSLTLERIKEFIKNHFKGVSTEPAIFELCLYADTPDNNPYIDRHPKYSNIIVGAGFSHGFKMAPVISKLLSELVLNLLPSYDLTPFKIDRYKTPKAGL